MYWEPPNCAPVSPLRKILSPQLPHFEKSGYAPECRSMSNCPITWILHSFRVFSSKKAGPISNDFENLPPEDALMRVRDKFEWHTANTHLYVMWSSRSFVKQYQDIIFLHCKNSGVKLTPAGVNTGPISNGVNLTPFWCYFQRVMKNTEKCWNNTKMVLN